MKYYAVKIGKVPGIYESLKKANKQVIGVSGAKMKSFNSKEAASIWMRSSDPVNKSDPIANDSNLYVVTNGNVIGIFQSKQYYESQTKGVNHAMCKVFQDRTSAIEYFATHVQAKKYYAIQKGRQVGVFVSSKVYDQHMKGVKSPKGQSYKSLKSAVIYAFGKNSKELKAKCDAKLGPQIKFEKPIATECVAYVDGSAQNKVFAFGIVLLIDGKEIEASQAIKGTALAPYRNSAGEAMAVLTAIKIAKHMGAKSITIRHDMNAVSEALDRDEYGKAEIWKYYKQEIEELKNDIALTFEHVKAHSGIALNVRADQLARMALKDSQMKLRIEITS